MLHSLLAKTGEAVAELSGRNGASPTAGLLALITSSLLALSTSPWAHMAGLALAATYTLTARQRWTTVVKGIARLGLIAAALILPAALIEAKTNPAAVALRTASATLVTISFTAAYGWKPLVEGLGLLSPRLAEAVESTITLVPRWTNTIIVLAAARQARTLAASQPLATRWKLAATAIGELLVKVLAAAEQAGRARQARTLGNPPAKATWAAGPDTATALTLVGLTAITLLEAAQYCS